MDTFFEDHYTVGTRDMDAFGLCRPSAVLSILQETATRAALALNVSRDDLIREHNAFWMLVKMWYRLSAPIRWNEALTIKTWHRGGHGASTYRDYDIFSGGERVGEAVSVWVVADAETHALLRMNTLAGFEGTAGGTLCKEKKLFSLRRPEALALSQRRRMQYSETDINGHINNSRYADYACDALEFETRMAGRYLSEMQINFLRESRPGDTLELLAGEGEEGGLYVRGVDGEKLARFDACLTLAPL